MLLISAQLSMHFLLLQVNHAFFLALRVVVDLAKIPAHPQVLPRLSPVIGHGQPLKISLVVISATTTKWLNVVNFPAFAAAVAQTGGRAGVCPFEG